MTHTTDVLKGLGGWIAQHGISTVILLAFAWWFVTGWADPLVQAHLRYLEDQVEVSRAQAAELIELRRAIEDVKQRLPADTKRGGK